MSGRIFSGLAWVLCGLVLAMIACTVALAVPNRYGLSNLSFLVAEVLAALVGGLVASKRPANPVGWFILGHALCFSLGEFSRQYGIYGVLTEPGALPLAGIVVSAAYWVWFPGVFLMFVFLPLYFPNGWLLSPRWRPVALSAVVFAGIVGVIAAVQPGDYETPGIPNPLGIEGLPQMWDLLDVIVPALTLCFGVVSASSLVARFRRARGEERQQIKWVTYAVALFVSWSVLDHLFLRELPLAVSAVLFIAVLGGLWVSIAFAVLRYRLYHIDLVINRTLVYGLLTATLLLTYFGGIALLQGALRSLTGQESILAVVASTLVIAALFNPLRKRIQAFIDRRFYRRKYDAKETLGAFSTRLREETDLDSLTGEMSSVVQQTMQPEHVSLWLRDPGQGLGESGGGR